MKLTWSIVLGIAVLMVAAVMMHPSLGSLIAIIIIAVLIWGVREAAKIEERAKLKGITTCND